MNLAVAFHMCYGPNTQLYTSDCCQVPASGQQDQPDSTGVICLGENHEDLSKALKPPCKAALLPSEFSKLFLRVFNRYKIMFSIWTPKVPRPIRNTMFIMSILCNLKYFRLGDAQSAVIT